MSLILSILAGLLGSLFGSAARAGAAMGRAQLEGGPMPDVITSAAPRLPASSAGWSAWWQARGRRSGWAP